ncbi:MAG: phosphatidate cytidylyltransferase [Magnetococcales bacterium]|nr:phosphatidate cytidylyltransferase [Magnetococcales bacterium]
MSLHEAIVAVVAGLFGFSALLFLLLDLFAIAPRQSHLRWSLFVAQLAIVAALMVPPLLGNPWVMVAGALLLARGLYELWRLCRSTESPLGWRCGMAAAFLTAQVGLTVTLIRGPDGFAHLMWIYMFTEMFDMGGYLVGKWRGRRYPFPRLSPHKSLEGMVGGLLAALMLAVPVNIWLYHRPWDGVLQQGVVILLAALAGDLATSYLKRRAGCKDFAPVSRHHGGVLDIYDALLMASPVYLLMLWLA